VGAATIAPWVVASLTNQASIVKDLTECRHREPVRELSRIYELHRCRVVAGAQHPAGHRAVESEHDVMPVGKDFLPVAGHETDPDVESRLLADLPLHRVPESLAARDAATGKGSVALIGLLGTPDDQDLPIRHDQSRRAADDRREVVVAPGIRVWVWAETLHSLLRLIVMRRQS
jgi:hypothetical protein